MSEIERQRERESPLNLESFQSLIFVQSVNTTSLRGAWEYTALQVAKWHMFSQEFAMLTLKEKMTVFRESWKSFTRLERVGMSLEIFGEQVVTDRVSSLLSDSTMKFRFLWSETPLSSNTTRSELI